MKKPEFKLITLITSAGKGLSLLEQLYSNNLPMVDLHHARGSHIGAPVKRNGLPVEVGQDIVTCVVPADQADSIFAKIYDLAEIAQPNGGFMYMRSLVGVSSFVLPAAP